jgi:hypothetical protein
MKPMKTFLTIMVAAFGGALLCRAGLPEPDNIVYGTIFIGTNQVTAASTNTIIEAWLTTTGPALASYAMGALPTAGNFYSLRVSLQNTDPSSEAATETGQPIYIVVRDKTGVRYQQLITVGSRLAVQRLDFGQAASGLDTNNLPIAWENYYFGKTGLNPNALTANGQTVWQNYLAGTVPNNPADVFAVNVGVTNEQTSVSFPTKPATGIGYVNVSRHYALDGDTNANGQSWRTLPGYTNIAGAGQTVLLTVPSTNKSTFYRGRVWLQNP